MVNQADDQIKNPTEQIQDLMQYLAELREREGRTERARLISIAITNLETAKLFLKEAN